MKMKAVIKRQDLAGLVISAILGLAITFLGSVKLKNAAETKNWSVTDGTITSSEVTGSINYTPSVNYTYTVDGTVFNSVRISNMDFKTKKRSVAENVIKKYPSGSQVKVYYNSQDPSESLLEPGANAGNYLLIVIGMVVLAIPIAISIFMKFDLRKDASAS